MTASNEALRAVPRARRGGWPVLLAIAIAGPAAAQSGTLSPASVQFDPQTVTTTSAARTITVANTHATQSFVVDRFNSSDPRYTVVPGGSCAPLPHALAAGQSCTVDVVFTPSSTHTFVGNFTVATIPAFTFAPDGVSLWGSGTPVPATLAPPQLAFGQQTVTTASAPQIVTVTNAHGTAGFSFTGVTINDARFRVVPGGSCAPSLQVPQALGAGASCTVHVAFEPTTVASYVSTLSLAGATPATAFTPATVSLTGSGTPVPATLSPATHAFGPQVVGTSATRTISISNAHDTASITLTGFASSDARFATRAGGSCGPLPRTLAAGASCTVNVAFTPDVVASYSGAFSIAGTTPATSYTPQTVNLSGSGIPVPLVLAPDALDFGEVGGFATSEPGFVAIGNASNDASLSITALRIDDPAFSHVAGGSCGPPPFALAGGASCTVAVVLRPEPMRVYDVGFSVGTASQPFSVAPASVSLQGLGGPPRIFADGFETP